MVVHRLCRIGHMPGDADIPPVHSAMRDERAIADEEKVHPAWTVMHGQYVSRVLRISQGALSNQSAPGDS
jgi:hypothetical protein